MKGLKLLGSILLSLVVDLVLFMTLFFVLMFVTNKEAVAYAKISGWESSDEGKAFTHVYLPRYQVKLDELMQTCGIECMHRVEQWTHENDKIANVHLYNERFTVSILLADRGLYGDYRIELYYYGADSETRDYEDIRPYVQLISGFTNYVAYDTKVEECDNHFKKLYDECVSEGVEGKSYTYHFDDLVGYVGYKVDLNTEAGYYYMAAENSNAEERSCVYFSFEGLLKPLPTDGD